MFIHFKRLTWKASLLTTLISLVAFTIALAASGDLDTTFSGDGLVSTSVGSSVEQAEAVAIQTNGKIVAAGYSNGNFALTRYNTNGALDTTFSGDGKLVTNFGGDDHAYGVAVQPNGKIVVSGDKCVSSICDLALARYNVNGTLDTTFNLTGKVLNNYGGGNNGAGKLAIQSDGKIVIAGYASGADRDFAVYRYNTNGTLDATFSGDGVSVGNFGAGKQDQLWDLALQGDGKIVLAGITGDVASNNNFAIARLNPNGTADTTFSGDGRQTTNFGADDGATALAFQPDGKIVVVGRKCAAATCSFALARYTTNGSLDTSFNATGRKVFTIVPNRYSNAYDVLITSNGRIVVAGVAQNAAGNLDFGLARLLPSGAFDTSFSGDGKVMVDFGVAGNEDAYALVMQPLDGRMVLAGRNCPSGCFFALARVLP